MVLFFRVLTRIAVMGLAYGLACLAATLLLAAAVLGWQSAAGEAIYVTPEEKIVSYVFQGFFGIFSFSGIVSAALMPFAVAALLTEGLSLRSWLYHVGLGGVIAVILLSSAEVYNGELPPRQDVVLSLAAGFIAGFVYWLLAGRNAGSWRVRSNQVNLDLRSNE